MFSLYSSVVCTFRYSYNIEELSNLHDSIIRHIPHIVSCGMHIISSIVAFDFPFNFRCAGIFQNLPHLG